MRALLLFLAGLGVAQAQTIAVTLDVQPRTFTVPATLTVTWSALGAGNCTASGGWNGNKAASGSEQVAGVVGSTTFELNCSGATTPVTVSWTNPTQNTDGTTYTNPKHTEVYRASSAAGLPNATAVVVPATATSYLFTNLPAGKSYFAVKAVSLLNAKSDLSVSVSRDVQASSGSATPVTVTGSTGPPPTGVVSVSADGYAVKPSEPVLDYILNGIVGTVQLGAPCDALRQMGATDYYAINRAKYVTWTTNRRPSTVVVQCAAPPSGTTVTSEPAPVEDYGK